MAEPIIIRSKSVAEQAQPGVQMLLQALQQRQARLAQQQSLQFRQQQFAAMERQRAADERQRAFTNALKMIETTGDMSLLETPAIADFLESQNIDAKQVVGAYRTRVRQRDERFQRFSRVMQQRFRDPVLKDAVGNFVSMMQAGDIDQTTFRDSLDDLLERTGDVSDEQKEQMQRIYPRLFALLPEDQAVKAAIEVEIKLAGKQILQEAGVEARPVSLTRSEREYEAALAAAYRMHYDKSTNSVDKEAYQAMEAAYDEAYGRVLAPERMQYVKNLVYTEFANRTIINAGLRDEILRSLIGGMIPAGGVFGGPEQQQGGGQGGGQPIAIPGLSAEQQEALQMPADAFATMYYDLSEEDRAAVNALAEEMAASEQFAELPEQLILNIVPRLALSQYLDEKQAISIGETPTGPRVGITYTPEQ